MHSSASAPQVDISGMLKVLGAQVLEEVPSKSVLYQRGAPASGLYYLEKGIIVLNSSENSEDNFVFEVLVPGDLFGEESFSAARLYGSHAKVLVRSTVQWIPSDANHDPGERLTGRPWVADLLVKRHQRALRRLATLCSQDVNMRILTGLVELSQWCPATEGLEASLPVSQAALAQLVCSTRETVSTKLNRLADDHLVQLAPSRIGIPSVARLREILAQSSERQA